MNCVYSLIGQFNNRISTINHIGIIAGSAGQDISGAVADQNIISRITSAIDGAGPGQGEVFEIVCQDPGDRSLYSVRSLAGILDDGIRPIHHIRVVAGTPGQNISAAIARQHIVQVITGSIDRSRADQRQIFKLLLKIKLWSVMIVSMPKNCCSITVSPAPTR